MWVRKLLPSLDLSIFPSLCLWDTHIWTEISSCLTQTYLHVFINVWARGFHSIMDTFISSIFFFLFRGNGNSPVRIRLQCNLFFWMPVENLRAKPASSNGLSKKHGSGFCQECLLCLWQYSAILFRFFSLNDKTKQSKKLTGEIELLKHTLAVCPVSILSDPFPGALWSSLNRDSQSPVKEKQWFRPLPFWGLVFLQLTFLKWSVCNSSSGEVMCLRFPAPVS